MADEEAIFPEMCNYEVTLLTRAEVTLYIKSVSRKDAIDFVNQYDFYDLLEIDEEDYHYHFKQEVVDIRGEVTGVIKVNNNCTGESIGNNIISE